MVEKHYTIKDIAREAGVSPALVSFALNNKSENGSMRYKVNKDTAKRILDIAKAHNYKPNNAARNLRLRRSRTIGVILSDISNDFFSGIARRVENEAFGANYSVLFGSTDENPEKLELIINTFLDNGVDGLIIVPCENSEGVIARLAKRGIPVVLLDRDVECPGVNKVLLDNELAAKMAVGRLRENGRSKIAMVSYKMELSNIRHREKGYTESVIELGGVPKIYRADYSNIEVSVREVMDAIEADGADAVLFATNSLSVEGVKALSRKGVAIPEKVAVVAFDGSEVFDLFPTPIAYIRQPIEEFAHTALNLVIEQIENSEQEKVTIFLNPELMDGESLVLK
ncbi:MAG: LacI family DNA-binding transcriptional regulator [Tidjanibacter sp.]|nr:LacI family DNA-binding transcriptional regulator [Tidjanibacter sp.]